MVLSTDLLLKFKNLFVKKNYSQLEFEIESLGNLSGLHNKILMFYAVSKALNPNSKENDFKTSAFYFEKIFSEDNSNREAFYNLIFSSVKAVYFKYLEPHLIREYRKNNKDPKILEGMAKMNFFYNNMSDASKYYKKLLEINPNFTSSWSTFLASLNYHYDYDQKQYLDFCNQFEKITNFEIEDLKKDFKNKKIKVGFFSADFRSHSVSFFLKDVLSKMNKEDFELCALSNLDVNDYDDMTTKLKSFFNSWNDTKDKSDEEFTKFCRSLNLDVLIDLAGYTYNNRINAFKSRCAPIQISWLGYCNTLGIKNMDFLIADPNLIKIDEENLYSEKILYMPKIWNVLSKPDNLPDIKPPPISKNKYLTYGSFNNFMKISAETVKTWSKILNHGNARLILKNSLSLNDERAKEILLQKFVKENVDLKKIKIINTKTTMAEHLECYNQIDIALDTFPYPGVTTSFQSILMGVPVLTMKGFNFNSRCGESININLGLNEFISEDQNDYFNKAIKISDRIENLLAIKNNLRNKAMRSCLFDTDEFVSNFSKLIKNLQ